MAFNKDIDGFKNEWEFAKYLNNRKIKYLSPMFIDLFNKLYDKKLKKEDIIYCNINFNKQKTDIIVSINGIEKRISIKKGIKNSVHVEPITTFINFLKENYASKKIINEVLLFQFADGTLNGSGNNRVSTKEYIINHQKELNMINKFFNKRRLVRKAINRFVLTGTNSYESIDAIIYGVVEDFIWITKDEIIKILMKHRNIKKTSLGFSGLFYQPKDRNLNYNLKYNRDRFCIQIKWYHLSDDIIEVMALYRHK